MKTLLAFVIGLGLLASAACGRRGAPEAEKTAGRAPGAPAGFSYINTGDLRAKPQLIAGWHSIEDGAWRWMAREAEAVVLVPRRAPANFELRLFFPPDHMSKAGGPVIVSLLLNGALFAQETYAEPGGYVLRKPVPPGILAAGAANLKIRLNRAVPPGDVDKRELGAVVQGFGFVQ